jgi:hypothetical protein
MVAHQPLQLQNLDLLELVLEMEDVTALEDMLDVTDVQPLITASPRRSKVVARDKKAWLLHQWQQPKWQHQVWHMREQICLPVRIVGQLLHHCGGEMMMATPFVMLAVCLEPR